MVQHKCSSYCPPNCPFVIDYCNYPILCDDYDCTNPKTCTELIASDCVIYEGTALQQYGIQPGQNATEIIIQLVNLVYPSCLTTTTTTSGITTTICQRPQGLSDFTFDYSIEVGGTPPSFNFTFTQSDACQALLDFYNIPGSTLGGFGVQAASMSINDTVYTAGTGTDCTVVSDGYYLCIGLSNSQVYHVVGGVLTEILICAS